MSCLDLVHAGMLGFLMITTIQPSHLSSSQSPMWYYVVGCVQYMQIPTRPNPTTLLSTLLPKFGNWMIRQAQVELLMKRNLKRVLIKRKRNLVPREFAETKSTESLVHLYSFLFMPSFKCITTEAFCYCSLLRPRIW